MIKTNIDEIEIRNKLFSLALLQYHKPYVHNTYGPLTFDCTGLVWYLYNNICHINIMDGGFGMSTTTKVMTSKYGKLLLFEENDLNKDLSILKKGDILFFHRQSMNDNIPTINNRYPGHCGLYLEDYYFIHASKTKGQVIISNFYQNEYWQNVLVASKDILSLELKRKKE